MMKHALWSAMAAVCVASTAHAQLSPGAAAVWVSQFPIPPASNSSASNYVPGYVMEEYDPSVGYPRVTSPTHPLDVNVVSGGSGGGGTASTVNQGTAGTSPWPVTQGAGNLGNPWWMEGLGSAGAPSGGVFSVQGVVGGTGLPVTGAFYQVTQPVSASSLPLPSGAATSALQNTMNTTLGSPFQAGGSIGNTAFGISGSLPAGTNALGSVSVSNLPATQAVSAATLPLPNGAATAANQTPPAAAGTSAASAMPVQGTAGGVPFSTTSYAGTASACSASTVGTSATLILDTAANAGRAAGGLVLPSTATAPVEYEWVTGGAGLTTTPGGLVFQVTPGGSISFAGAPSAQLYAISTSSQAVSCMAVK